MRDTATPAAPVCGVVGRAETTSRPYFINDFRATVGITQGEYAATHGR